VATAYVMYEHLRVTLAIRLVLPGNDTFSILEDPLKRLKSLGVRRVALIRRRGDDLGELGPMGNRHFVPRGRCIGRVCRG